MTSGYSGTPLAKKLGIKPGSRVALLRAPVGFETTLEPLPAGVRLLSGLTTGLDVILCFTPDRAYLTRRFDRMAAALERDGGLWIAWPKKSSGVSTDLAFDVVQRVGLGAGLVDNKVCAVDEIWSGLRFVYRLADR